MKLACRCGEVLTHELTHERVLFPLVDGQKPLYNVGQYARDGNWLAKVLEMPFPHHEAPNGVLPTGAYFHVPERIPSPQAYPCLDEDPIEMVAEEHDLTIETLRFTENGTLVVLRNETLPAGWAMAKRSVLPSIIPPWPVHDYQAQWREEHPNEPFGAAPEWPEGSPFGGCCNWGNLEFMCRCGNLLGLLEIDCYQYRTVTFYGHATTMVL